MAKPIGAYQLGEAYARSLGVNAKRFRAELILLSSILSACVTAFAGPVSFVGIAVPQLVKRMFGTAKPIVMIPGSFLGGAVFCLLSDLIARTMFAPTELSISSVTAVFGAPVVIWMMIRQKGGAEMKEQSYLRTEDLAAGYDGTAWIREISIHASRGEIVTLIGPNGAGNLQS